MREIEFIIVPPESWNREEKILDQIVKYIDELIQEICDKVKSCDLSQQILEDIAQVVMDKAYENASMGYQGLAYGTGGQLKFPDRAEITKFLYSLSPHHIETEGLSAGYHILLSSLMIGDEDNIYELNLSGVGDYDYVEVGTRFGRGKGLAKLLEDGGKRSEELGAIGFYKGGKPKKWLIASACVLDDNDNIIGFKRFFLDAMSRFGVTVVFNPDGSHDVMSTFRNLYDRIVSGAEIPPRPFLKPALWHTRDGEEHTEIAKTILSSMGWGLRITIRT